MNAIARTAALEYYAAYESIQKASGEKVMEHLAEANSMSIVMKSILREEADQVLYLAPDVVPILICGAE
jgi:hypothetical protein